MLIFFEMHILAYVPSTAVLLKEADNADNADEGN